MEQHAKKKKDKYLEACRERRRDFTPLVYTVDGFAAKETRAAERRLAGLLASKWDRPYSEMVSYVRTRMSMSIIRTNSMLLRGGRANSRRRKGARDGVTAAIVDVVRND